MLYAIKSDTLFFNRSTNRVDLEAFSYLYPLADAALIRKMEGAEITSERLDYVTQGAPRRHPVATRCSARSSARCRARTSSPTSPTSSCSSKTSSGRSSPGIVNDSLVVSVRNLGYTKNAGEFVRRFFADIGSAGGHRAMAKAVVPLRAFREKFGDLPADGIGAKLQEFAARVPARTSRRKLEVKSQKLEAGSRRSSVHFQLRTSSF